MNTDKQRLLRRESPRIRSCARILSGNSLDITFGLLTMDYIRNEYAYVNQSINNLIGKNNWHESKADREIKSTMKLVSSLIYKDLFQFNNLRRCGRRRFKYCNNMGVMFWLMRSMRATQALTSQKSRNGCEAKQQSMISTRC